MRRIARLLVVPVLAISGLGGQPASAEGGVANAIVSEGSGAAVFIGYGGNRQISLQWRPAKQYDSAVMLYQLQRADGPMLESRQQATTFVDLNLQPNTAYTYKLTVFQLVVKATKVKGQVINKTITKTIGRNQITVTTDPSAVINLRGVLSNLRYVPLSQTNCQYDVTLTWEAPLNTAKTPVTYEVIWNNNIMVRGLSALTYSIAGMPAGAGADIQVLAENATGLSVEISRINAVAGYVYDSVNHICRPQ